MLKLKGQTESGEWVEFWVYDIVFNDKVWTVAWCISSPRSDKLKKYDDIKTDTIQPAEPCQHLISLMAGLEIPGPEFWYNRHPHDLELVGATIAKQAKSALQTADDSRKAMLAEIRERLGYVQTIEDKVNGWAGYSEDEVDDILNEMEAKL